MELRQLKYFVRIADFGNMTRAAEDLHVAQPALSQQIRNLEDELGVQLLHRFSSGVRPTEAGAIFRLQAEKILHHVDETRAMVRQERDVPSGEVVLGLPSSTSRMISIPMLGMLLSTYPGIRVKFIEAPSAELIKLFGRGDADLVIAVDPSPNKAFIQIPLGTERLYVIRRAAPSGQNVVERMTVAALAKIPLVLMPEPNSIRLGLDSAFRRASLTYDLVSEITSTAVLVQAVRAGMAATVLPWSAVCEEVASGQLTAIPLAGRDMVRNLVLCSSTHYDSKPATQVVLSMIVAVTKQLIVEGKWQGIRAAST